MVTPISRRKVLKTTVGGIIGLSLIGKGSANISEVGDVKYEDDRGVDEFIGDNNDDILVMITSDDTPIVYNINSEEYILDGWAEDHTTNHSDADSELLNIDVGGGFALFEYEDSVLGEAYTYIYDYGEDIIQDDVTRVEADDGYNNLENISYDTQESIVYFGDYGEYHSYELNSDEPVTTTVIDDVEPMYGSEVIAEGGVVVANDNSTLRIEESDGTEHYPELPSDSYPIYKELTETGTLYWIHENGISRFNPDDYTTEEELTTDGEFMGGTYVTNENEFSYVRNPLNLSSGKIDVNELSLIEDDTLGELSDETDGITTLERDDNTGDVYVGDDEVVYEIDSEYNIVEQYTIDPLNQIHTFGSEFAVLDGLIYYTDSSDNHLYSYDTSDDTVTQEHTTNLYNSCNDIAAKNGFVAYGSSEAFDNTSLILYNTTDGTVDYDDNSGDVEGCDIVGDYAVFCGYELLNNDEVQSVQLSDVTNVETAPLDEWGYYGPLEGFENGGGFFVHEGSDEISTVSLDPLDVNFTFSTSDFDGEQNIGGSNGMAVIGDVAYINGDGVDGNREFHKVDEDTGADGDGWPIVVETHSNVNDLVNDGGDLLFGGGAYDFTQVVSAPESDLSNEEIAYEELSVGGIDGITSANGIVFISDGSSPYTIYNVDEFSTEDEEEDTSDDDDGGTEEEDTTTTTGTTDDGFLGGKTFGIPNMFIGVGSGIVAAGGVGYYIYNEKGEEMYIE